MASPPPASSSFDSSMETSTLSEIAMALDDIFLCTRPKQPKRRLLQVAKTCYTTSEQDIAKNGKHDSVFILDSRATSHLVGDVSLFSPSFRSSTTLTTPAGSAAAAAAAYQAHDGRVLTVAGVGTVSCDNFRIPNVRCLRDLCTRHNLVSVQQLAECGYLVMFGGGQCSVVEQSSGKIVGKGRFHADDGLYHLELLNIPRDKACEDSIET